MFFYLESRFGDIILKGWNYLVNSTVNEFTYLKRGEKHGKI